MAVGVNLQRDGARAVWFEVVVSRPEVNPDAIVKKWQASCWSITVPPSIAGPAF